MRPRCLAIGLLGSVLAVPSAGWAQNVADPSETARFHLGPVSLTPRIGLRNVGLDTNVFNLSETPERDFTATLTTGADTWLRVGRAYFSSRTTADWVYFQKAGSQRSLNLNQEGRVDVDLLRLVPRIGGAFVNSRQRPNDEFDLRVQQRNVGVFAGVMVPVGSKARVDLEIREQEYDYAVGKYGDSAIASALNRKSQVATLTGGFEITPLTRLAVRADSRRDRFTFTPARNSTSLRVMPGVEFEPSAVVSGKAFLGWRRFETPDPVTPDVTGFVASVELKFVAADMFRLTGVISRDVDYSLDLDESVFISTSMGVEILQALGLDWDVVGRVRHATLAYQYQDAVATSRVDRVWLTGGGLGRRLGTDIRVGFDVDYVNRSSVKGDRAFDGFRFGASVTYGY